LLVKVMSSGQQTSERPLQIGKVIQNAIVFNCQNWGKGVLHSADLPQTVAQLFALLEQRQIKYVLVGGLALLQYIEGRNTEDIDLIMALRDLRKLHEVKVIEQNPNFAHGTFQELKIDLLLTRNRLFAKVQKQHSSQQPFFESEIPCATVEGLVLLKLYALPSLYRQGNFARVGIYENDLATLIFQYKPDLAKLFNELAQHLSDSDLVAVREVVADIQQRMERFRKRKDF